MGKVFLIASGKGGTGKTMFSVNLGATLALAGKKTLILDMDMGLRNVDLYSGQENNMVYDAYDVMTGTCCIDDAIIQDERLEDLYIMGASPFKEEGRITPLHSKVLCEKLAERFDYVLIDGPSGLDDGLVIASAGADATIIVSLPEYASLRNADSVDMELRKLGIKNHYLILNGLSEKLMRKGYTPPIDEITHMMRAELVGVIQRDVNIHISTNIGIPVVLKQTSYIAKNFRNIAIRLGCIEALSRA